MKTSKGKVKLSVNFFQHESGNEPVRDWLKTLPKEDKRVIGQDITTVQFGWPIGMPLVDYIGKGLWEIRSKLRSRRIARILFFLDKNRLIAVNGFIKKTRATPKDEIKLASKRKTIYLNEKN